MDPCMHGSSFCQDQDFEEREKDDTSCCEDQLCNTTNSCTEHHAIKQHMAVGLPARNCRKSVKQEIPPLSLRLPMGSPHACCSRASMNCWSSRTAKDCPEQHTTCDSLVGIAEQHTTCDSLIGIAEQYTTCDSLIEIDSCALHDGADDAAQDASEDEDATYPVSNDNCEYTYIGSVATLGCSSPKSLSPSVRTYKEASPLRAASARQTASPLWDAASRTPRSTRPKCSNRRSSHLTRTPDDGPRMLSETPRSPNHWMLNSLLSQEHGAHADNSDHAGRAGRAGHWLLTTWAS